MEVVTDSDSSSDDDGSPVMGSDEVSSDLDSSDGSYSSEASGEDDGDSSGEF